MAYFAGSNVGFGEASRPKTSNSSFSRNIKKTDSESDSFPLPSTLTSPLRSSPIRSPPSPLQQQQQYIPNRSSPIIGSSSGEISNSIRNETVRSLLGELHATVTDYASAIGQPIHTTSRNIQGLRRPLNPSSVLSRPASSFGGSRRNESRNNRRGYSQEEIAALSEPFFPGSQTIKTTTLSKSTSSRPSLLDTHSKAKLQEISKSSDDLISALAVLKERQNVKKGLDSSLYITSSMSATISAPAISFGVNTLKSKRGDTVRVFSDRAEYTFIHPFLSIEVDMVMYFRDMIGLEVRSGSQGGLKGPAGKTRINFHLLRNLEAFGTDGISPSLYIEFVSPSVALRVYDLIHEATTSM